MKFIMNNRTFQIKEVSQEELREYKSEEEGYFYGQTHFLTSEVWLYKDIPEGIKRETLYHELMHCYIVSYITTQDLEFNEDMLCDISSRSHNMIHTIVEDYFKEK